MISRREVVTAGVLGTFAAGTGAETVEAQSGADAQALKELSKLLDDKLDELRSALEKGLRGNSMDYGGVAKIKEAIEKYAKTSGKFPEYCDIGLGIFHDVYDWHARHQQQINISRVADQRLAIQFMFTQLILRWENDGNYVGTPFDR